MYLTERMLPDEPDSLIFGFTRDQMRWCERNEKQMWIYLVEHKLLFSQDPMDIRKLVNLAPFTSFFISESPGRAAVWMGWQIVKEYAERNPEMKMADVMAEMDYESILRESRYDP